MALYQVPGFTFTFTVLIEVATCSIDVVRQLQRKVVKTVVHAMGGILHCVGEHWHELFYPSSSVLLKVNSFYLVVLCNVLYLRRNDIMAP